MTTLSPSILELLTNSKIRDLSILILKFSLGRIQSKIPSTITFNGSAQIGIKISQFSKRNAEKLQFVFGLIYKCCPSYLASRISNVYKGTQEKKHMVQMLFTMLFESFPSGFCIKCYQSLLPSNRSYASLTEESSTEFSS